MPESLLVFTCNTFKGREGAPVAALIVARDAASGAKLLNEFLALGGLGHDVRPDELHRVGIDTPHIRLLADGSY